MEKKTLDENINDLIIIVSAVKDNMITKEDAKTFATKDDLKNFVTKDDIKSFATKDDLTRFATKDDLKNLATKGDINEVKEDVARIDVKIDEVQKSLNKLEKTFFADSKAFVSNVFKLDDRTTRLEKHVGLEPQPLAPTA